MNKLITVIMSAALTALTAAGATDTVTFGDGDWAAQGFVGGASSSTMTVVDSANNITFELTAIGSAAMTNANAGTIGVVGGSKDGLIDAVGEYITLTLSVSGAGAGSLISLSLDSISPGSFNGSTTPEGLLAWDGSMTNSATFAYKNPVLTYAVAPLAGLNELTHVNYSTWSLTLGHMDTASSSYSIKNVAFDYEVGSGSTNAPTAPSNLTATAIVAGIALDWDDNSTNSVGFDSYSLYRSDVPGSNYVKIASNLTSSDYSDVPLPESTAYYYVVTAIDDASNESTNSVEASATTLPDGAPPAVPTGLTAIGSGGLALLDWDDNTEPDLVSYGVYRNTSPGGVYTPITNVTESTYLDAAVANGVTYYYKVTALDVNSNESAQSGYVDFIPSDTPQPPTNLTVVVSNSYVTLTWDDTGFTNRVYRKIGTGDFALISTLSTTESSFVDYGFGTSHTYTYRITEVNSSGLESLSTEHVIAPVTPAGTLDFSPVDPTNRPNIILVMADDQGWGDTGYNGHYALQTPEMDEMAADGFVFNRFYAAPDCSPSRASIFTGRQAVRSKVYAPGHYLRSYQESTLPKVLKNAGYVTGLYGKFHLGSGQAGSPANPSAMGFDEWVIGLNYFDNDPYLSHMGTVVHHAGESGSVALTDEAIDFLNAHKNGGKPMFATVWFPAPHNPNAERCSDPLLYDGISGYGYFQEITLVDEQLGRIRQWLRDNNLEDNTIVWYCSDNGGLRTESSGGRDKKGETYEGGLRVPSVVEWPARQLNGSSNIPAVTYDMYPTLLALLGITVENQPPLDGVDLRDVIEGDVESRPGIGFWDNITGGQGTQSDELLSSLAGTPIDPDPKYDADTLRYRIKKEIYDFPQEEAGHSDKEKTVWLEWPWKLHERDLSTTYLLYNLETDPMETTDLSGDPAQASRVAAMQASLAIWKTSVLKSVNGGDYAQEPAWLPMNYISGLTVDDADGSMRGNVTNVVDSTSHWVAGRHNMALSLDGSDDALAVDNPNFLPPVGVNERTISAWIKTTGSGVIASWGDVLPDEPMSDKISTSGSLWQMSINGSGRLHLDVNGGSITGQTDLRDGSWHHVAFVFANDGTPDVEDVELYVDGASESISASTSQGIATRNSYTITLGGDRSGSALEIDEFRIYPTAFSSAEVFTQYSATNQSAAAWYYAAYGTESNINWTADTDMDNLTSLDEYAWGNDPHTPDVRNVEWLYNPGTGKLEISFARRVAGTHELTYTVRVSNDLETWDLPATETSAVPYPALDTGIFEWVTVESDDTIAEEDTLFMRVDAVL